MKICVCDDDKYTAEKIRGLIKEQTPEYQVDVFSCGEDVLADGSFDIAFLDIQMRFQAFSARCSVTLRSSQNGRMRGRFMLTSVMKNAIRF